jgi:hypothetical protein
MFGEDPSVSSLITRGAVIREELMFAAAMFDSVHDKR